MSTFAQSSLKSFNISFKLSAQEYNYYMNAARVMVEDAKRLNVPQMIPEPVKVGNLARVALKIFVTSYMNEKFKIAQQQQQEGGNGIGMMGGLPLSTPAAPKKREEEVIEDAADEIF